MRKQTLLAVVAALLAAAGAPAALAGNDVLLPDGSVYRAGTDGSYHLIPDVATANALGVDWNALEQDDSLPGPAGDPLAAVQSRSALGVAPVATAARVTPANGDDVLLPDGTVWQGDADGTYHLIPNVATANAMHVDWNALDVADALPGPAGDPLPSAA